MRSNNSVGWLECLHLTSVTAQIFTASLKIEFDKQLQTVASERAARISKISNFKADLHQKIRQLSQMMEECDVNTASLTKGYDGCVKALRADFA